MWYGEEAGANYKLAGGWKHLPTSADAVEVLNADGLKPNTSRHLAVVKCYIRQGGRVVLYNIVRPLWFFLLDITRPLRNALGLRTATLPQSRGKV